MGGIIGVSQVTIPKSVIDGMWDKKKKLRVG